MNSQFQVLSNSEVISVEEADQIVVSHTTFKVGEFLELLKRDYLYSDEAEEWLGKGISCEILSPSKGWRKGKVKISLAFCPDETDSLLDDIRQQISEEGERD
ncbi:MULTISPECIES: KGK domain-containing protein [Trichocoleus]|uniref:KGK domain-containing protein n=1 Tax=Trichocoleus desertorum GB2-A4 TaxID=2933944 RepID=A0ABV0JAV9_9CYAN|nr:KGK domain-containing protein [Trichocoleus sp. FACHB-46]MBD1861186.1 KGK family protein [Trichocoleus sp. FACHB-46]